MIICRIFPVHLRTSYSLCSGLEIHHPQVDMWAICFPWCALRLTGNHFLCPLLIDSFCPFGRLTVRVLSCCGYILHPFAVCFYPAATIPGVKRSLWPWELYSNPHPYHHNQCYNCLLGNSPGFLFCFVLWDTVSCTSDWAWTYYVDKITWSFWSSCLYFSSAGITGKALPWEL